MNRRGSTERSVNSIITNGQIGGVLLSSFKSQSLVNRNSAFDATGVTGLGGNLKKDINMNSQGFKYPDRVYGHKFNNGYRKDYEKSNGLKPKQVHKPLQFGNLQSLSYYRPTIVTREYQREMPPNLIEETTKLLQQEQTDSDFKQRYMKASNDQKGTTYAQSFFQPNHEASDKMNKPLNFADATPS